MTDDDPKAYSDRSYIRRTIPLYPHPKLKQYYRTVDVLLNPSLYKHITNNLATVIREQSPSVECLASIASRGHLYGPTLSLLLGLPLLCIQKTGKLAGPVLQAQFSMVTSSCAEIEMSFDKKISDLLAGKRLAIIDDSVATGGTMVAAAQLIEQAGGLVVGCFAPFNDNRHGRLATFKNKFEKMTTTLYDFQEKDENKDYADETDTAV